MIVSQNQSFHLSLGVHSQGWSMPRSVLSRTRHVLVFISADERNLMGVKDTCPYLALVLDKVHSRPSRLEFQPQ